MGRPGITEVDVVDAIETLLEREANVTVESIRAQLQRGSPNTINRHLRTWKAKQEQTSGSGDLQVKRLRAQNLGLKAELNQQQWQLQNLTEQLLTRDRKLVQLEKELTTSQAEQVTIALNLSQVREEKATITAVHNAVVAEREQILAKLIAAQKEQLTQFSRDLQSINTESLTRVREIGLIGQDQVLVEKIKVKDLTEEVKNLQAQIKELQQTLEQTKNLQLPFQKRLQQQEQLIANCLDPKKVEQFTALKREQTND